MNTKHCLIVDDSEIITFQIKNYLTKIPLIAKIAVCSTASEALHILRTEKIDFFFLDIELPDFSGLSLLRSTQILPPCIIISSHAEYALESYEIGKAVDYLHKPFSFERFLQSVNRVFEQEQVVSNLENILLKKGRVLRQFRVEDIHYIESYGIYTKIHTVAGVEIVNENMLSLEKILPCQSFVRVHKSYIVNLKNITEVSPNYFRIANSINIPIGRSYRSSFKYFFHLLDKLDEK